MKFQKLCLAVFFCALSIGYGKKKKKSKSSTTTTTTPPEGGYKQQVQRISEWEYCEACKITVEALFNKITAKVSKAEAAGGLTDGPEAENSDLYLPKLAANLCEYSHFENFQSFAKFGCNKILVDNVTQFLVPFEGPLTTMIANPRKEVYDKMKDVCVDSFQACPQFVFESGNIAPPNRNQCAACEVVAHDLEALHVSLAPGVDFAEKAEGVCSKLGYYHQPYMWMEDYCDTMVADHLDDISAILEVRRRAALAGTAFAKSPPPVSEEMCGKFYSCHPRGAHGSGAESEGASTTTTSATGTSATAAVAAAAVESDKNFSSAPTDSAQIDVAAEAVGKKGSKLKVRGGKGSKKEKTTSLASRLGVRRPTAGAGSVSDETGAGGLGTADSTVTPAATPAATSAATVEAAVGSADVAVTPESATLSQEETKRSSGNSDQSPTVIMAEKEEL